VRSECHGLSAAMGKLGGLVATIVFSYGSQGDPLGAQTIFVIAGFSCLMGLITTILFIPNTTMLELSSVDQLWEARLADRPYSGPALADMNLSYLEIWLDVGKEA